MPERAQQAKDAEKDFMDLVDLLMEMRCKWCIENPVGVMSTKFRQPDQCIQPYEFGDNASKRTCLWLYGLPKLKKLPKDEQAPPREVMFKGKLVKRWANQSDSGQNNAPNTADRWKVRSKTYPGIAKAMADQWGDWDTRNVQVSIRGYLFKQKCDFG